MVTIEQIQTKAALLDSIRLQELGDFLDFLLTKSRETPSKEAPFPPTNLESPTQATSYRGRPLSLEEMDRAIEL